MLLPSSSSPVKFDTDFLYYFLLEEQINLRDFKDWADWTELSQRNTEWQTIQANATEEFLSKNVVGYGLVSFLSLGLKKQESGSEKICNYFCHVRK